MLPDLILCGRSDGAARDRWRLEDLLEVALAVLWGTRLSGAGRPLDDVGSRFEYAGFSWWKFWNEHLPTGDERVVPVWEALSAQPDWRETLDSEAQRLWQLDLQEAFLEYATWNGFACARDDGAHYDQEAMGCLLEEVSVPVEPLAAGEEVVVVLDVVELDVLVDVELVVVDVLAVVLVVVLVYVVVVVSVVVAVLLVLVVPNIVNFFFILELYQVKKILIN